MLKYSPQHPILEHPQPTFLPSMSDQVSHPYKTTGKIIATRLQRHEKFCVVINESCSNRAI
jgi:hypothetical protein